MTEKRIRVNIKQTAKGLHYLDVTVDVSGEDVLPNDVNVLEILKIKEDELKNDGRLLVGDES